MTSFLNFKLRPNGSTSGGKVYTYLAGTYTPKATYPTKNDAANTTNANSNPVLLDDRGEADIFVRGPTKVVLMDANDNLMWTADNFDSINDDIISTSGSKLIRFNSELAAVNNLHMTNSATTNAPILSGVGNDASVGVRVGAKGTGKVKFPIGNLNINLGNVTVTSGSVNLSAGGITLTSGNLNVTAGDVTVNGGSLLALPAGLVTWSAGFAAPSGWLECTGAAVSRTTYSALFSAIGTTYGTGDGSTTFNLPNQARRVLVGKGGSGTGTLGNTVGSVGGAETHTLTTSELPAHAHVYNRYGQNEASDPWAGVGPKINPQSMQPLPLVNYTSETTGGGAAHNIMQPSLVAMMIIRAY